MQLGELRCDGTEYVSPAIHVGRAILAPNDEAGRHCLIFSPWLYLKRFILAVVQLLGDTW